MSKAWINCFVLPSRVQGENIYRIRQLDGTIIEGYSNRQTTRSKFSTVLNEGADGKGLVCIWGVVQSNILSEGKAEDGTDKLEVLLPDGQLATVKASRAVERE